jgi:hypothetical protein
MKSELLILWAEKVSDAAVCNLGEAFMTIYKKRCLLSLRIRDAYLLKHTIFLNHVLLDIEMKHKTSFLQQSARYFHFRQLLYNEDRIKNANVLSITT